MNEDFDKRLTDHIKAVFDSNYNSNDADAGWLLLRQKYPQKTNRKPFAWFWWLTFAAMLSGLGTGVWQIEKKAAQNKARSIKMVAKPNNNAARQHWQQQHINRVANSYKRTPDNNAAPIPANPKLKTKHIDSGLHTRAATNWHRQKHIVKHRGQTIKQHNVAINTAGTTQNKNASLSPRNQAQFNDQATAVTNNTNINGVDLAANDNKQPKNGFIIPTDSARVTDTVQKNSNVIKQHNADTTKKKTTAPAKQRVVWGIFTSAFYGVATGSGYEFNLGGGGTADIRLFKKLGISTGLGIMRNTLTYNAIPGTNGKLQSSYNGTSGSSTFSYLFKNYSAKMWVLDIPLNLKYSFSKSYNFIAAGLSSYVYTNEYYDTGYYKPGSPDEHITTQNSFAKGNLLKTLNFSAGFGRPIGTKSVLIFEPFLKAPLGGLGSQNLTYVLLGINLKLNFQSTSK